MVIKLYQNSKYGFPLISFLLMLTCAIVTIPTAFQNKLYYVFSLRSNPFYFWQIFSGIFEHSIFPSWFIWPHFLGNMSIVLLFGILIERLLGSGKMLILTTIGAISYVSFFQIRFIGQTTSGSGASGIVYSYAPVALYILWKFIKKVEYNHRKDIILYLLGFEFLFIWGFVTAVSSWTGTNIYHAVATIAGICFLLIFKKHINLNLDYVLAVAGTKKKEQKNKWIYCAFLLPVAMLVILFLYTNHFINDIFIDPISISSHGTIQDIKNNNNEIKLVFENPITDFNNICTSGLDASKIIYSQDRKVLHILFENGLHSPYEIKLSSAYDSKGRVVRDIFISIKE